jgi:DNA-3-methyladenine glycosylase
VRQLCSGPGKLTQALDIELDHNRTDLVHGEIQIAPRPPAWREVPIAVDARIGITKAAELPWRFSAAGSPYVSRPARSAVGS